MSACEHMSFSVHADVVRLTDGEGGPVVNYVLDVRVKCSECGLPFMFKGLPIGMSLIGGAYTSADREEARLVIELRGATDAH